jgi:hypothetical protein
MLPSAAEERTFEWFAVEARADGRADDSRPVTGCVSCGRVLEVTERTELALLGTATVSRGPEGCESEGPAAP